MTQNDGSCSIKLNNIYFPPPLLWTMDCGLLYLLITLAEPVAETFLLEGLPE
jgi:hypothetical protein